MNGPEKSDGSVVPRKRPNEAGKPGEEAVEGRGPPKGNAIEGDRDRTLGRAPLNRRLDRVREAAQRDRKQRFTSLFHHVHDVDRLRAAYQACRKDAAPGIGGITWQKYGQDLETRLQDLAARLKRMGYRARPALRVEIPKADGGTRPLGVPCLEDKIVQRALAEVLEAIYEVDFLGFSYGFRPGRGAHRALDALAVGIQDRRVNWVLDADIRGFFDALDHDWIVRFLEHRIGDQRIIRLVRKWLGAGVVVDGKRQVTERGTVQGGSISPLLANLYLHHVFDLWAHDWRQRQARGDVVIVRYADDFVVGFEHREEAEKFLADLRGRMEKFGLELHPEKTRLLRFGRHARTNSMRDGDPRAKPGTFDFLGFTHTCGQTRGGAFKVFRRTRRKAFRSALRDLKEQLRRRRHLPVRIQAAWLASVIRGHVAYFGVPFNSGAITRFRWAAIRLWKRSLERRSQRARLRWDRFSGWVERWLPRARICHPYAEQRFNAITRGRSPVR